MNHQTDITGSPPANKPWMFYVGIHRGTLTSRDSEHPREAESLEHCQQLAREALLGCASLGCDIWYCYAVSPSGERTTLIQGVDLPMKTVRVQLDVPSARIDDLNSIMTRTGLATRKDIFEQSLALFEWAVEQVERGRVIGAMTEQTGAFHEVIMPSLAAAKKNYERVQAEANRAV